MRSFKITDEKHSELMKKFSDYLKSVSMTTNSFSFSYSAPDEKNKDKVMVTFTMKAYIKMRDLVDRYASEVGWFGFIDKLSDLEYRITDICVYPQLVTGATVKETNEPWDDDMPIDQIRRRHFHGHSHVNMMPSPSGTDINHRRDQMELVKSDSFYLFLITNKSCAWTAALFDLANNTVYDTDDILLDVDLGDGEMLSDFVEESRQRIKQQTPTALKQMLEERTGVKPATQPIATTTNGASGGQSAWLPKAPASFAFESEKKQKNKKEKKKKSAQKSFLDDMTEDELEDFAATQADYYDDMLGYVSDTPMVVNDAVLRMMR